MAGLVRARYKADGSTRLMRDRWLDDEWEVVGTAADCPHEEIAEYLDSDAENENHHSMVGAAAQLATIVKKYSNDIVATQVMREVLERGGLINLA